jgi:hypothetical protein
MKSSEIPSRNPCAQAPNKVDPFLPGLKTRGLLGRSTEEIAEREQQS